MKFSQPISFRDVTLYCVVCGKSFTFTPSQQITYADRGWPEPRRCPSCRKARHKHNPPTNYDEIIAQAKRLFPNDYRQGAQQ